MGNHLEPPSEGDWGRKIAEDDFHIIAKAGFNTVRIPVRWAGHSSESAPYAIDANFMVRVQHVVGLARAAGLNVILDSHNFDALHKSPDAANTARLAGLWAQIGKAFAKASRDHLWFEIENEPHDKLDNANLGSVVTPALAAIRATNPDRPVIIGGEFWSGIDSLITLTLPSDPDLVPTFHYYEPFDFTHQGATWVDPSPPMGRAYGTPEDQQRLTHDVQKVRAYVARTGKTPFMGEFGSNAPIPLSERVRYQASVRNAFDTVGIGMCAWGYTNTFPLYDSDKRAWLPGMRWAMGLHEPMPALAGGRNVSTEKDKAMHISALLIAAAASAAIPAGASAKQPTPELQALDDATPGTLINDPSRLDWDVYGKDQSSKAIKSSSIPGGGAAIQINVAHPGATVYEVGTNAPITAAIAKSSDVTIAFWARTTSTSASDGKGRVGVRFQQNAAPYPGFGDTTLLIGSEWTQYEVTARANRDIPQGQAVVAFQLAGGKQVIEIGQAIIVSGARSILAKPLAGPTIELHPKLVGLGKVITDYGTQSWPVYGSGETHKFVFAKEVPGGKAVQFTVSAIGKKPFDTGITVPVREKISEGDTLTLALLARAVSAETPDGKGALGVRIQQQTAPYPGFADHQLLIGSNWGIYQIKTTANMTIEAGKGAVGVHLAGATQVIEIGQIYLINTSGAKLALPGAK
jgi:endoglucanase